MMEDSRLEGRERACKVGGKTQAEYRQAKAIVRECYFSWGGEIRHDKRGLS